MHKQLVPADVLARADKILFITHLAIGDFLHWQTYFKAFHKQYPRIKIHIWVDEICRTRKWWKWSRLRRLSLYDWLRGCSFIDKVYSETYSPGMLKCSIMAARIEHYPIVVSLAQIRYGQYARLARRVGPRAFVAGITDKPSWKKILQHFLYRNLDARCLREPIGLAPRYHITDLYALWFEQLFGVYLTEAQRRPFMEIPRDWRTHAKLSLLKWGVTSASNGIEHKPRTVFINIFAKDKKDCWTIDAVFDLITMLRSQDYFSQAYFILNAIPTQMKAVQQALRKHGDGKVILFSTHEHFFQLPATLELCDLVIAVESAVMHIAAALKVPVVGLMTSGNEELVPWDKECSRVLMASGRSDWVKNIPPAQVIHEVNAFLRQAQHKSQA
jgi:ADP-heptose:LPS heptosyltransferase